MKFWQFCLFFCFLGSSPVCFVPFVRLLFFRGFGLPTRATVPFFCGGGSFAGHPSKIFLWGAFENFFPNPSSRCVFFGLCMAAALPAAHRKNSLHSGAVILEAGKFISETPLNSASKFQAKQNKTKENEAKRSVAPVRPRQACSASQVVQEQISLAVTRTWGLLVEGLLEQSNHSTHGQLGKNVQI